MIKFEFQVITSELLTEMTRAIKFATKSNMVLDSIYIKAENNTLTLKATNLDLGVTVNCPAQTKRSGEVVVNAYELFDAIKAVPKNNHTIDMWLDDNVFLIKYGKTTRTLQTITLLNFPEFPIMDDTEFIIFNKTSFYETLKRLFPVFEYNDKTLLRSVYFKYKDSQLDIVATDGNRLSLIREIKNPGKEFAILINNEFISKLKPYLKIKTNTPELKLFVNKSFAFFEVDNITIYARIVNIVYPNYAALIESNESQSTTFKVNRKEFISILKSYGKIKKYDYGQAGQDVVILSRIAGSLLEIKKVNLNNTTTTYLDVDTRYNESFSLKFNPQQLKDAIESLTYETITLQIKDKNLIVTETLGKLEYTHVLVTLK